MWARQAGSTRLSSSRKPSGWFTPPTRSIPSRSKIARDLDVSTETLRKRVNRAQIDAGERDGLTTEERQELRRLREEVKVPKEEREVLKKAASFFAREEDLRARR